MFVRETGLPYPQPWEFVLELLKTPKNLTFIDVGANDGYIISNTAYLEEQLGWTGICVEPHPEVYERLIKNRKNCKCYNVGVHNEDSELEFLKIDGYAEMLSGFVSTYDPRHKERVETEIKKHGGSCEVIKVPTKTLNTILTENNISKVDYLSIDTEGSEFFVLQSIDFNKFEVSVISVEDNYGTEDKVTNYLSAFGFKKVAKICGDLIYQKVI